MPVKSFFEQFLCHIGQKAGIADVQTRGHEIYHRDMNVFFRAEGQACKRGSFGEPFETAIPANCWRTLENFKLL